MSKTVRYKIIILLMISIGSYSCVWEQVEPSTDVPENVSFQNDLIPMFNQNCNTTGCHDLNGTPPDLSPANAYMEITTKGWIDATTPENSILYKRMIDTKSPMPPWGVLDYPSKQVLSWIKEGAKNN